MMRASFYSPYKSALITLSIFLLLSATAAQAQTTSFTYQGHLTDSNNPANGNYDLQFALFDSLSGETQIGATHPLNAIAVANGGFTVQLDFGASAFPGADRFLEIGVRPAGGGAFTILSPRQQVSSTPYAIRSLNATTADTATTATNATNATQLGGVAASQYVVTSDSRLADSRAPTAGSANYIQNTTSPQASSNFNVSGSGTVGGNLIANGNVGIGTTPTRARLETRGAVGNTVALFGGDGAGVALIKDNPYIGFNSYYNSGWKAISPGFGGYVGIEQGAGAMTFGVNPSASSANAAVAPIEAMRITQSGRVGIGTSNPGNAVLDVEGSGGITIFANNDSQTALFGQTVNGTGVFGYTVSGDAVFGYSNGSGNAGNFQGTVVVSVLGASGDRQLCYNSLGQISTCSSSLRYKKDVAHFAGGLDIINRLRPIAFTWKQGGMRDVGLAAEEVEKVEPLLTFRNDKGEIEGVKYNQLSAVFVNAFKEQQAQIEQQQKQIATLLTSNAALNARLRGVEKSLRKKATSTRRRR
jgi:hypothetical protein